MKGWSWHAPCYAQCRDWRLTWVRQYWYTQLSQKQIATKTSIVTTYIIIACIHQKPHTPGYVYMKCMSHEYRDMQNQIYINCATVSQSSIIAKLLWCWDLVTTSENVGLLALPGPLCDNGQVPIPFRESPPVPQNIVPLPLVTELFLSWPQWHHYNDYAWLQSWVTRFGVTAW